MKPSRARIAVWLLACVACATPALSFQQISPPTTAPAATPSPSTAFDLDRNVTTTSKKKKPSKTEKKGFRALGILPDKLNFGLELLYGAPETDGTNMLSLDDLSADDMVIRGRIKKRF